MTTKTDITLPEPAFKQRWHDDPARYTVSVPNIGDTDCYTADQVRAAVEADRQDGVTKIVPSDKEIADTALRCFECDVEDIEAEIRALLSRYSGQPAASAEPDHETALALADAPRSLRDYVAALRCAPVAQKPVAWLVDWPDEPELGHYFAEAAADIDSGRSRALVFADTAPVAQPAESVLVDGIAYTIPAPVAAEILRLHIELKQAMSVAQEPVSGADEYGPTPGCKQCQEALAIGFDSCPECEAVFHPPAAQAQPVAFAKNGALFWYGDHAVWRGFSGDLYLSPTSDQDREDADLLDWLREETCDLRCINEPTGGDDYDVRWIVIRHHMAKPHEREIGRSFTDDPRDAIRAARAAKGGDHG